VKPAPEIAARLFVLAAAHLLLLAVEQRALQIASVLTFAVVVVAARLFVPPAAHLLILVTVEQRALQIASVLTFAVMVFARPARLFVPPAAHLLIPILVTVEQRALQIASVLTFAIMVVAARLAGVHAAGARQHATRLAPALKVTGAGIANNVRFRPQDVQRGWLALMIVAARLFVPAAAHLLLLAVE
jgi:hypothetical protein